MSFIGITEVGSIKDLLNRFKSDSSLDFIRTILTNPRMAYFNSFGENINPFKLKRELRNIGFKGRQYPGKIPVFMIQYMIDDMQTAIENSKI